MSLYVFTPFLTHALLYNYLSGGIYFYFLYIKIKKDAAGNSGIREHNNNESSKKIKKGERMGEVYNF